MAIRKGPTRMADEQPNTENNSEPIAEKPVIEKPMLFSQWVRESATSYKKSDINIFQYKVNKYKLSAFTPSDWDAMFKGTKAIPSK